jgi:hypothetical protein
VPDVKINIPSQAGDITGTAGTETTVKLVTGTGTMVSWLNKLINVINGLVATKYTKPSTGIPDSDMEKAPLKLGSTSTTAMKGDTKLLTLGTGADQAMPGNTTVLTTANTSWV